MTALHPDSTVRTTCPYCGVGCQMNLHIKEDQIYRVEAPFDSAPILVPMAMALRHLNLAGQSAED